MPFVLATQKTHGTLSLPGSILQNTEYNHPILRLSQYMSNSALSNLSSILYCMFKSPQNILFITYL